jgi:hypothetical protein
VKRFAPPITETTRALVVADSDSYLKWGAGVLGELPPEWEAELVILVTPVLPSAEQIASALAATPLRGDALRVLGIREVLDAVRHGGPDVVVVSTRGPVARGLIQELGALGPRRPVIVTGMPGISIPATKRAVIYRAQADLLLLHSRREVREFTELAERRGVELAFGLATLPFLTGRRSERAKTDVVFAAQAKVPVRRDDRVALLEVLADAARQNPQIRVVVKVRAQVGEQQTHFERFAFPDLLHEMIPEPPQNLVVSAGPMDAQLDTALALVTVSSTAIVEAVDRAVPVLAIDDFGIGKALINEAFVGSGLLGPSSDLLALRFREAEDGWRDDNYLHPPSDNDWLRQLRALVTERRAQGLPRRRRDTRGTGGVLRRAWDRKRALGPHDSAVLGYLALAVGTPLRGAWLAARWVRRSLRLVLTHAAAPEPQRGDEPLGLARDRVDQR